MPRTAGKMGFLHVQSQNCHTKLKIGVLAKRPKVICWAAPILIFVFFGGAPGFSQKRVFQNRPILAETTENVVPKGRGRKTQFLPWFWSIFLCSCWLCLFFWLVPLLLILLHHSVFSFQFCLLIFLSVVFLLLGGCMSSCSCASYFLLLLIFLLLWFLLFITYVIFVFSSFLSLCFFFSPGPSAHLKKKTMEKKDFICLPFGDLCENVLSQNHSLFVSLVDFFHPLNIFHVLGLRFEVVRDSLLLLIVFFVFWCLEPALRSVQFVFVLAFFGFVVFFVRAIYFLCLCLCGGFYGFWFVSFRFSSSSWDCLSLIALSWCCFFYLMSWLLVCLCGFLDRLLREPSRGVVWVWPTGRGQYIFRLFS